MVVQEPRAKIPSINGMKNLNCVPAITMRGGEKLNVRILLNENLGSEVVKSVRDGMVIKV